ncbi:MAG TPA: winged helix DNA-binding domain-containing protein [Nocardioidaceae bacterium]|nr:winged helix DNA-binding domain-containing protein [Nocardioidaceae bacterium]
MSTPLSRRVLNRTLLQRQHLLERARIPALEMTEHVVGLQAQNTLPPYLSRWSRIENFEAGEVSDLLEQGKAVRILGMRGTIHLVSAADCLEIRPLVQGMLDKQNRTTPFGKHTPGLEYDGFAASGRAALSAGPLTPKALGLALAERHPDHEASHLSNTIRTMLPLVQLPPRGMWKGSAGQNYETAEKWLGAPLSPSPDMRELVRRYLRAFGPATAADVTAWSRITGVREVLETMKDELVAYEDENGRRLVDLEGSTSSTLKSRHRCGCSASTTTSSCPTPTAPASWIRTTGRSGDWPQRWDRAHDLRWRTPRRPVAARRGSHRGGDVSRPHQVRAARARCGGLCARILPHRLTRKLATPNRQILT